MAAGGGGAEEVRDFLGGFDLGVIVLPPLGDGGTDLSFILRSKHFEQSLVVVRRLRR
jgi:hypothetical protein